MSKNIKQTVHVEGGSPLMTEAEIGRAIKRAHEQAQHEKTARRMETERLAGSMTNGE